MSFLATGKGTLLVLDPLDPLSSLGFRFPCSVFDAFRRLGCSGFSLLSGSGHIIPSHWVPGSVLDWKCLQNPGHTALFNDTTFCLIIGLNSGVIVHVLCHGLLVE